MKMTNGWNRFIYRLWAPIYDGTVNKLFLPGRRRAIQLLDLKPGERVLLAGVGTGADLPLLPEGVEAVGVDISPEMLSKARAKLPLSGRSITLIQGDAHHFAGKAGSFDAVIFNLILSVIPDGRRCLQENLKALKPEGRAVVFDKFAPESGRISIFPQVLESVQHYLWHGDHPPFWGYTGGVRRPGHPPGSKHPARKLQDLPA